MLPPPESIFEAYRLGLLFCFAFGGTFSIPAVWNHFFKKEGQETYLKAGEYGEAEANITWSVFKEPLNAWTSLVYSLFGVVICFVGYMDYFADPDLAENNITMEPVFSLLIGAACIYLGISSFLFHASHTETWRKADAGMTSGICVPLVVFAIWDRTRLHGVNSLFMVAVGLFMIFSLTHGFVPYGSSDILLPLTIIIVWSFELVPRYGGPMHDEEYLYWARCLFAVLGGAVLRAVDIKRSVANTKTILLAAYFTMVAVFGVLIGFTDDCTICALVAGVGVALYPARGHVCWHVASAYALYIWWYLLRTRPGNPETPYHSDSIFMNFVLFVAVKNGFRRLVMNIPTTWLAPAYQDRVRLLVEHALFTVWGFVTIVELPGVFHSWLLHPILCWYKPVFPNRAFLVYYTAKVATYVEDAIYLWVTGATYTQHTSSGPLALPGALLPFHIGQVVTFKARGAAGGDNNGSNNSSSNSITSKGGAAASAQDTKDSDRDEADPMRGKSMISAMSSRSERAEGERMRGFHHNIAALMAVVSLFAGYAKVGSLVALSHDACEVALDLFKIAALRGWRLAQIILLSTTIVLYVYWRVWFFTTSVLYTVTVESKHMLEQVNCEPGACTWMQVPERLPFLACLLLLLGMNCVSIYRMCKVGYRIVNPTGVN